ncbi:hypothetical protein Leryth_027062 [Lithospermum erythrorhizon]|nr:hypothetical protein Leryth_027062 [Lithospermum erythrorhizon]
MAMTTPHLTTIVPFFSSPPRTSICSPPSRNCLPRCSSPLTSRFMDFPFVSPPHKQLMVDLISSVETSLGSSLLPCSLPPDVQHFESPNGDAQGSLYVRSGDESSLVDFILGSWVHCKLPSGGELNITSLSAYLRPHTDAPNFLIELIRSSPTSLILMLDLPPRKDLVLHPDYLKTFYEETELEKQRQLLEKLPEVQPYFSTALYIRAVLSPTAIMARIEAKADESARMEDIIHEHISPVAKDLLKIWLELCANGNRKVEKDECLQLAKRDKVFKNMTIEIDLGSSFPRLFGHDVATRILGELKIVYNA